MSKISAYSELAEAPASTDEFVIVDKSDTSISASGTTKKVQAQYLTISDASTTVKGKVELATDAETITGTDTVRAITPSNYKNAFDETLPAVVTAATSKGTPVDADELGMVDSAASNILKKLTWANLKATLLTYFNTVFPGKDGWMPVSVTWTYASATTITVPSGAASLYSVGDKIKLTQTTEKYFYIVTVADTLLTVTGGSEYAVANAAISSIYVSHMSTPIGFPEYFNYTPTGPTNTTLSGRFSIEGKTCFTTIKAVITGTPNWTNMPTLPVTVGSSYLSNGYDTSSSGTGGYLDSGTINVINGITPTIQAGDTTCRLDGTANSTIVSATNPITWAINDTWIVRLNYEI